MQLIPDTGPGLSGFLAHGLWLVYQYFPLAGAWDWLLLFLLLGLGAHFVFLPYLWRSVKFDMLRLQQGRTDGVGVQGMLSGIWGTVCLLFFIMMSSPTC